VSYRISAQGGEWVIYARQPGYLEAIGNSPVALYSVLFLAVILAFMLVLIHIAGRRWQAEGRFATAQVD
jgi:hypothetical protein